MYCVPDRLSEGLVQLPESGMGYQLVRVLSKGDGVRFVILMPSGRSPRGQTGARG